MFKHLLLILVLMAIISLVHSAPVTAPVKSEALPSIEFDSSIPQEEIENDTLLEQLQQEETFPVQVDRLAQLIATHLQFDHLDAVISGTDKAIALEFQHHIQINVQDSDKAHLEFISPSAQQQYTIQDQLPTLDMMDLEILKSQISAAIQAHTEGNLPLTWDKIADRLSRQAIESYLRQSVLSFCSTSHQEEDLIMSDCLSEHATELAGHLDTYIYNSLDQIFETLDQEALPDLLQHTAQDLKGILRYFNSAFLSDGNKKFVLQVVPWNSDPTDIHNFKSKLLEIAVRPAASDVGEDNHSTAFFTEYAHMARV